MVKSDVRTFHFVIMGKVKQVKCQVAGCTYGEDGGPFVMDKECTSVSKRTAEMMEHTYQAHILMVDQKTAEAAKIADEASKVQAEAAKVSAAAEMVRAEKAGAVLSSTEHGEKKAIMTRPTVNSPLSKRIGS